MSDPDAFDGATQSAAQALRDAAKWLVAGVAGTAAGVLAGSSLTSFGALPPGSGRFVAAAGGLLVSLAMLGAILFAAIRVLTLSMVSVREVAEATDPVLVEVRRSVERACAGPLGSRSLRAYSDAVAAAAARAAPSADDEALLERARDDAPLFEGAIRFWTARAHFDALVWRLKVCGSVLAVAIAVFAWAANPAKAPALPSVSVPPGATVTVTMPAH